MASELAVGARPEDLIPGAPEDLERLSGRLSTFGNGMVDAARRLSSIEAGGEWRGQAADAFRSLIGDHPRNFDNAGSAFSRVSSSLSRYAEVLREAQADARRATQLFEEAERQSQGWKQDWDRFDTDSKAAAASGTTSPTPRPTDVDPGSTQRAQAQKLLEDARSRVHTQARTTTSALAEDEESAPDKPGLLDSFLGGAGNLFKGFFKDGVWGAVTGIWDSFTALLDDPVKWIKDTWDNIYDHIAFWNWDTFSKTWVEFGKEFLAWDEWAKSPMRALGQVLFNVATGVGVGKLVLKLLRRRGGHHEGGEEAEKRKREEEEKKKQEEERRKQEHEENIKKLTSDTNKKFRLTRAAAERALRGPEGSTPEVRGEGVQGADVAFHKDGNVVLERELKNIAGKAQGTFNREVSDAAGQVNHRGEVFVQVPDGTDALRKVNGFRGSRPEGKMDKYRDVRIIIVSESGDELFNGPLAS